ncbi:rod shape-determining protein MreD [Pseudobacillus badius]|uniref:rod shape-determining protein MreD n=1 Tax=Bacillus badius TaxID=1455 RepID=UPI0007B058A7|nr:rod shape-determining protein MreD [Bacillus badius]KZN98685.1 rod shape-determining protein MreD [Bacillus badius]MED0666327.1 rod shape-determining protein MreD [Bacillus badius]OCS83624.1 rod shape-determining protein MreD [Bacillus badius]OVE53089.1 rod shape-determining protein MreD [Bacillus badius]TDW05136.1 rod shape-determining protein MreD [Bacillus badius]
MKRLYLPLLMIALFYSDNLFVTIFPEAAFDGKYMIIPRFFTIGLLFMAVFFDRNTAIKYGFLFGFLFDIFYTGVLGAYMFFLPFVVYVVSKLVKVLQNNLFILSFIFLFGVALLELIMFQLNVLIERTEIDLAQFVSLRLGPTLLLNLIFYLLFAFPLKSAFEKLQRIYND